MFWRDNFTNHTTGTAFNLRLSHDQASLLAFLENYEGGEWRSRTGRSTFIPCFHGLERRGLAEHNPAAKVVGMTTPHVKLKWVYRLTPAGKCVLKLLKFARVIKGLEETA